MRRETKLFVARVTQREVCEPSTRACARVRTRVGNKGNGGCIEWPIRRAVVNKRITIARIWLTLCG